MATEKISIKDIRIKYPSPTKAILNTNDNEYCVGGALILAIDPEVWKDTGPFVSSRGGARFPGHGRLCRTIHAAATGKSLKSTNAYDCDHCSKAASDVIHRNDHGSFEAAWDTLGTAIQMHP